MGQYIAIADMDDEDLTEWQRQLRVNAFMKKVKINDMITEALAPCYEN